MGQPELKVDESSIPRMEALFREEHGRIFRLCLAMLGNHHDAEEAVQESFLRVFQRFDSLEGDPRAYLMVVARRVCWGLGRGRVGAEPLDVADELADPAVEAVRREILAGVLSGLAPADRRLISGSYAGYSYDEMAEMVGSSPKAVSVALFRARQRARKLLEGLTLLPPALRLAWARLVGRRHAEPAQRGLTLALATCTAAVGCLLGCFDTGSPAGRPGAAGAPPAVAARGWTGEHPGLRPQSSQASSGGPASRPAGPGPSKPAPASELVLPPPAGTSAGSLDFLYKGSFSDGQGGLAPYYNYPHQPEGQDVQALSVSPDYQHDHLLFATGTTGTDCYATAPQESCYPFVLVSRDGGASWQDSFYTSSLYGGGGVLFPPGDSLAPDDSTPQQPRWSIPVLAAGQRGLEMNVDGASWSLVTPIQGIAAIDLASTPDNQQVLIGATTLMRVSFKPYHNPTSTTSVWNVLQPNQPQAEPGPVVVPGGADSMLFAPGSDRLLIAYHLPGATPGTDSDELMTCAMGTCRRLLDVASAGALSLQGVSTGPGRGLVLAYSPTGLWLADSQSLLFQPVTLPVPGRVTGAALSVDGRGLTLAMHLAPQPPFVVPGVLTAPAGPLMVARSDDLGRTWSTATSSGQGIAALTTLTYLPDGHLLAIATGADPTFTVGLICSYDEGMTWRARC